VPLILGLAGVLLFISTHSELLPRPMTMAVDGNDGGWRRRTQFIVVTVNNGGQGVSNSSRGKGLIDWTQTKEQVSGKAGAKPFV
jgi:hypothetical protein